MKKVINYTLTLLIAVFVIGCRPYKGELYEEIAPNETAFVISLEGDASNQVKFDSAAQLEKMKVASRRIQISRRWKSTGRLWFDGTYIPTMKVLRVDRTPVTVEWEPVLSDNNKSGDGIWVESSDSIGFSTGFRITAQIEEEDTALYLYCYRGNALSKVLENEVKSKVQEHFATFTASYTLDNLRNKKNEMYAQVKEQVLPFFEEKGITITTIAMYGGFTYENPEIQTSIDKTFIAQQEKVISKAQFAAQQDKNSRIELEAKAAAEAIRIEAQGKADAIEMEKGAEAKGIRLVTEAAEAAQGNPLVLQLKKLEIEKMRNEKWDGKYPVYYMNMGSSDEENAPSLLLTVPTVE